MNSFKDSRTQTTSTDYAAQYNMDRLPTLKAGLKRHGSHTMAVKKGVVKKGAVKHEIPDYHYHVLLIPLYPSMPCLL
jgi:hypothetical protein